MRRRRCRRRVCEFYDITGGRQLRDSRSIPNRIGRWPGDWQRPPEIEAARQALFEARTIAPAPGTRRQGAHRVERPDDLLAGRGRRPARASRRGSSAAADAARFLLAELRTDGGRWRRAWHASGEPRARHDALAADHAALVDAFVRLAEATGEASWIGEATATADTLLDHFWDVDQGGLFTTPDDGERLIVRQKDIFDNATPSANSTAAVALLRLAALTGEARYANHADRILQLLGPLVSRAPSGFANALARRRAADPRDHRDRRRRRPPRPPRRGPRALAPASSAGLGRALRLAALGQPPRRPRLRLRALRLPGPRRHPRGAPQPSCEGL